VRAGLIPAITGRRDSAIAPAPRADARRALAPSTLLHLPGADARDLGQMVRLASLVPSYRLELGSDLARVAGLLAEFLSAPSAGG
jgi:hypothetical protein